MLRHAFESVGESKKRHGLKRLVERFGVSVTEEEYEDIVFKITEYVVTPIHVSEDDGKSFHIFEIDDVKIILLFDWEYEVILTAYRMAWWEERSDGTWYRTKRKTKRKDIRRSNREFNLLNKLIY